MSNDDDDFVVDDDESIEVDEAEDMYKSGQLALADFRKQLPVWQEQNSSVALWSSSVPGAGMGIFVLRKFRKGEPITEYRGFLISDAEARALPPSKQTHVRTLFPRRLHIDGMRTLTGEPIVNKQKQLVGVGIGAFANQSPTGRNNAIFTVYDSAKLASQIDRAMKTGASVVDYDPSERLVYIKALRDIDPFEEVFCFYGAGYNWDA
jgi:hypothetical protein